MSDWSEFEVDLIIADYFEMLEKELKGIAYNKSTHRRRLAEFLTERNEGAIEFKHQNISAALIKNGIPYINGYKPRWNYQNMLEEKTLNYFNRNNHIENTLDQFIQSTNFSSWIVPPPELISRVMEPQGAYDTTPIKKNYLELEQKNISIGFAGEKLAMEFEKWKLNNEGFPHLADKVEWVSQYDDTAGFDILSKSHDGKDIFIEVKTTTLGKDTPFFFSKRENDFSEQKRKDFNLYRVFDVIKNPKMFNQTGRFQDICNIEPINFKGYF